MAPLPQRTPIGKILLLQQRPKISAKASVMMTLNVGHLNLIPAIISANIGSAHSKEIAQQMPITDAASNKIRIVDAVQNLMPLLTLRKFLVIIYIS